MRHAEAGRLAGGAGGGGTQTRAVGCTEVAAGASTPAPASACAGPAPTALRSCVPAACAAATACGTAGCSARGLCGADGVCACAPGYSGAHCEVRRPASLP